MGYLRFFAAIADVEDVACLDGIPSSIPWRAFRMPGGITIIEWLKRPNPNNVPRAEVDFSVRPTLSRRPAGVAFERNFGAAAPGLDELYASLAKQRKASTLPAVAAHTTLLLHRLSNRPVLGIASDDEDWDFACEAKDGKLHRTRFLSADEELLVDQFGRLQLISCANSQRILHRIASEEARSWSPELAALFGFDGDIGPLGLVEIGRSRTASMPEFQTSALKRPWWRLW